MFHPWPRSVHWGSSVAISSGVGRRHGLDLWHRPAAVALTEPLAWELPYAAGTALKKQKNKKERKKYNGTQLVKFIF